MYYGPPFSGSTAATPTPGHSYAWLGDEDESISVQYATAYVYGVGDVVSWSVTEPGTPHVITDSAGSTGVATITVKAQPGSYFLNEEQAQITVDAIAGTFSGTISVDSLSPFDDEAVSGTTTLTLPADLNLLNSERRMDPIFEQDLQTVYATYIAAVTSDLDLVYNSTNNPVKSLPAWQGNVWTMLKALCAANRQEIVANGNQVLVRDIGTRVLDLTDYDGVTVRISLGTGKYVDGTHRGVKAVDNGLVWNYAENPSLETNGDGWGYDPGIFGSATSGRVSN